MLLALRLVRLVSAGRWALSDVRSSKQWKMGDGEPRLSEPYGGNSYGFHVIPCFSVNFDKSYEGVFAG